MNIDFSHKTLTIRFSLSTFLEFNPAKVIYQFNLLDVNSNAAYWQDSAFFVFFGTNIISGSV